MEWIKETIKEKQDYEKLLTYINEIESSLEKNTNKAVEACKSLIDAICTLIMDDLNKEVDTSWDSPKLIKKTLDEMPFISISKKETPELTKKLCGNLQTLCGSFCEIRNNNPFLSHGTSITQENLDKNYAKLVVKSTEAIGGFLLSIHDKTLSGEKIKIAYEKNEDFNESFDESFDEKIKVGKEYEFFPSEILFNCDFEAYKQELSEYKLSKENLNKKEINSQN